MRRALISAIAVLALAGFVIAGERSHMTGPKPGDAAPAISLADQNGKTINLSDYSGKIVVLEWFNNECPFVQKQYKNGDMNALAAKYADKGVVWLAINSTSGKTASDMTAIANEWKINRPILLDSKGEVGRAYGSMNTPTMYVIGKDGKLLYRGAIDDHADANPASIKTAKNYVAQALDETLAGKPVSEPMTKAYGCSVKYGG